MDLITHYNPPFPQEIGDTISVSTGSKEGGACEVIPVTVLSNNMVRIQCIPFFVYGLFFHDIVIQNSFYKFPEVIVKSDYWGLRVFFDMERGGLSETVSVKEFLVDYCNKNELLFETHSSVLMAIAPFGDEQTRVTVQFLEELIKEGPVLYETGW